MDRHAADDFDDGDWDEDKVDGSRDDDVEPTVPCPYCGKEILEDSPRCPYCERYISDEDSPPRRKSWLIIIGTILCLYVAYRWITN